MKRTTLLLWICWFSGMTVYAQDSYDLIECLSYTLENSPKLKSEKLSQEKETFELMEQRSSFLPSIDAYVNYHHYFNDLPTYIFPIQEGSVLAGEQLESPYPVELGLPHNLNTGFEIQQTIFDRNFFGSGALSQRYQSYKSIRLSIVEEDVLYETAVLFYNVAVNQEKLSFLEQNIERLLKLSSIVELQVEQGFAKQTDLDKLMVKTSTLNSKRNKLKSGINQQIGYLKLMMGLSQEDNLELTFGSELNIDESNENVAEGLQQQLLEEQRELNELNSKRSSSEYLPKLQAFAAFNFQAQRQSVDFFRANRDWYNVHQWGLRLSIPIMRGLEKKNRKEVSQIVDAQIKFGLEQQKKRGQLEYDFAIQEWQTAMEEEQAQKQNVELAERMYQQSQLIYEQGSMLLMDFLDSEATLREAKMMYATTALDTRLAELKILKASGSFRELIQQ